LENVAKSHAERQIEPSVAFLLTCVGAWDSDGAFVSSFVAEIRAFKLARISFIRSDVVIPLREVSYILYVNHAMSSVNAVSGRVT
jgi:hypothetical protein